jgi:hypothetical protein
MPNTQYLQFTVHQETIENGQDWKQKHSNLSTVDGLTLYGLVSISKTNEEETTTELFSMPVLC